MDVVVEGRCAARFVCHARVDSGAGQSRREEGGDSVENVAQCCLHSLLLGNRWSLKTIVGRERYERLVSQIWKEEVYVRKSTA